MPPNRRPILTCPRCPQRPSGSSAIDAGDFIPDSVTNKMVRDRLSEDAVEAGFLLDGYPAPPRRWITSMRSWPAPQHRQAYPGQRSEGSFRDREETF
jgi:hypothetical protein